jgi:hypothetical protein
VPYGGLDLMQWVGHPCGSCSFSWLTSLAYLVPTVGLQLGGGASFATVNESRWHQYEATVWP